MQRTGYIGKSVSWFLGLSALVASAPAQTDRINDTPTGWWYWYGATSATIDADIAAGRRPFNITPTSGNYDVIEVQNSGEYAAAGMDAYWATTTTSIGSALALSNKRIIDLEPVNTLTGTWSALVVNNSGTTAAPGWDWATGLTFQGMINWQAANGLRPIDVDQYSTLGGTRYSVVAVPNTGTNHQSGWWWYFGATEAQVTSALTTNSARLIDIDVASTSPLTFNAIMVSENPGLGVWHPGLTSAQVSDFVNQNGVRLTCLQRYTDSGGTTRFAVAGVDNANAQTRRLRSVLLNGTGSNAVSGVYLKEVGGPVLVSLNASREFEPASMLKILYHAYAIDRCASNLDDLDNQVYTNDRCNNDECPVNSADCNPGNEPLSNVLREMMEQSDNPRTYEVEQRFGRANLNAFATALGCTGTRINHSIGCGNSTTSVPNTLTLQDCGAIYEAIADGTLFNQTWQNTAYELMNDTQTQGLDQYTEAMIDSEAANTSLTAGEIADWKSEFNLCQKRGGYGISHTNGVPTPGLGTCCIYHYTRGGWASVPSKVQFLGQWIINRREYVLADFINNEYVENDAIDTDRACFFDILREQVRAALQSWDAACSTPVITNQPDPTTVTEGDDTTLSVSIGIGVGDRSFRWWRLVGSTWNALSDTPNRYSGVSTNTLHVITADEADETMYRCVISSDCGNVTSTSVLLTVNPPSGCDSIDFNGDTLFPDTQDIADFLTVFGGGACPTGPGQCGDIDFNNDGLFPDTDDISAFIRVFGGGPC
ncbi:MAG: serine hydrolase [Phycisphaerales bacterium]